MLLIRNPGTRRGYFGANIQRIHQMFKQICFTNLFFRIYLLLCNLYNHYNHNDPVFFRTIHRENSNPILPCDQDHIELVNRWAVDCQARIWHQAAIELNFKKKNLLFYNAKNGMLYEIQCPLDVHQFKQTPQKKEDITISKKAPSSSILH